MGATLTKMAATGKPERPLSPYAEKYRWKLDEYHPSLKQIVPALKRFASDVIADETPYWLTILGPSGVGKTFALKQAYSFLRRNEHLWEVGTQTGSRLPQCAHIIPGEDLNDWQAPKDYGKYDLIYVEDIGAGAGTEKGAGAVTTARVAELLQYRTGRWTLLCANKSMAQVAKDLDPRIASRLLRDGSVLIELPKDVPDYNLR